MCKNNGLLFIAFHVGNEKLTADNFLDSNISLDFYMHDLDKIVDLLKNNNFESFLKNPLLVSLACIVKSGPLRSIPNNTIGLRSKRNN